jgi:Flp pilus assembly protein TadG
VIGRSRSARPGRRPGGQATVELAIGFPIVLVGVLIVLQLALVGRDQLLVSHAAREAARSAAVDARAGAGREGALASSTGLDPDRLHVEADRIRDRIRVRVTYRSRTALPIVGGLIPDPVLNATVTMLDEEK